MIKDLTPSKKPKKTLQPKHRQMAEEYLANGLKGAEAARTCGYKQPHLAALRIFNRPEVRRHLENRLAQIEEQQFLRRAELLSKMKRLNDFNLMTAAVKTKGGMLEIAAKDFERVAQDIGDCVTEIEVMAYECEDGSTESKVRIKLMDKDKNFDRELKYFGILDMDGKVNINVDSKVIDFDKLCSPPEFNDVVEGKIMGSNGKSSNTVESNGKSKRGKGNDNT